MKRYLVAVTLISLSSRCVDGFVQLHNHKNVFVHSVSREQEDLFDAEETAAWESHDALDPGVQAAMGERAVMIVDESLKKRKGQSKSRQQKETRKETLVDNVARSNPMKILYRAYKMAYDLVAKKRDKLKHKMDRAEIVEQQYMMTKRTTEELAHVLKLYQADPMAFKKDLTMHGKDESTLAMEVLERVIAVTEEEMHELELEEENVITSFLEALQREEMAEARYVQAKYQEAAARENLELIEKFSGKYEVDERRRDMAQAHLNVDNKKMYRRSKSNAVRDENELLTQEFDMKDKRARLKKEEEYLKADLKEVQRILSDQLRAEWEAEKEEKGNYKFQ